MNPSKTYLGVSVNHRIISGEQLAYSHETNVEKSNWWLQCEIYNNMDILTENCVKSIPLTIKGEMIFHLPDLNELLRCILYKHFVPIELIKIVDTYYGDYASVERLMYSILAKLVYKLNSYDFGYKRTMPCADHTPYSFSRWLQYDYPIYMRHAETKEEILMTMIFEKMSPTLFYKYYKELNNLGDDFEVPMMSDDIDSCIYPPIRPIHGFSIEPIDSTI